MGLLVPVHVMPPAKAPGPLGYARGFLRNPLEVVPRAAYEEDLVPFGWGRTPRFWVTSPDLIRAALVDERDKFRKAVQIRILGPLLGRGILTSEGAEWKWQRQAAAPIFRPPELAAFVPACVRAAGARVQAWREQPGATHAIDVEMTRATFDVVAATLLPTSDAQLAHEIHESLDALQDSGAWALLLGALNLPRWLPRPGMLAQGRALRRLRAAVAERAIRKAREGAAATSLTHRLIAARDPETGQAMSDERLVDNVLTFYLAGHETTARALTWTLYLLSRAPDWARRLEAEVDEVAGAGAIGAEHLDRLVLVQQVLQEAMRLYPPVPIMSRQAIADVRLEGLDVKAGASLLFPIYAIHRHRRRWENPDAFLPERFAGGEGAIPRHHYMPFGAGPRICIGRNFAMLEAAVMLATFVRGVRFERVEGAEPRPLARVTLLAEGGMPLRVVPR